MVINTRHIYQVQRVNYSSSSLKPSSGSLGRLGPGIDGSPPPDGSRDDRLLDSGFADELDAGRLDDGFPGSPDPVGPNGSSAKLTPFFGVDARLSLSVESSAWPFMIAFTSANCSGVGGFADDEEGSRLREEDEEADGSTLRDDDGPASSAGFLALINLTKSFCRAHLSLSFESFLVPFMMALTSASSSGVGLGVIDAADEDDEADLSLELLLAPGTAPPSSAAAPPPLDPSTPPIYPTWCGFPPSHHTRSFPSLAFDAGTASPIGNGHRRGCSRVSLEEGCALPHGSGSSSFSSLLGSLSRLEEERLEELPLPLLLDASLAALLDDEEGRELLEDDGSRLE